MDYGYVLQFKEVRHMHSNLNVRCIIAHNTGKIQLAFHLQLSGLT